MSNSNNEAQSAPSPDARDAAPADRANARPTLGSVKVNTENLKSDYCNVAQVNGTREEVVFTFGLNQDWDRSSDGLNVELLHRVVLSPFAAKRLNAQLTALVAQYSARFGEL